MMRAIQATRLRYNVIVLGSGCKIEVTRRVLAAHVSLLESTEFVV